MLSGKTATLFFFGFILCSAALVFSAELVVKEDKAYVLSIGDSAKFQCPAPAAGTTTIKMYLYKEDGTFVPNDNDVITLKGDKVPNVWTCTPEYAASLVNAKVDIVKEGDKAYAPSSPLFQCATEAKARIFCEIASKPKPSSAYSVKHTVAISIFGVLLSVWVLLY